MRQLSQPKMRKLLLTLRVAFDTLPIIFPPSKGKFFFLSYVLTQEFVKRSGREVCVHERAIECSLIR